MHWLASQRAQPRQGFRDWIAFPREDSDNAVIETRAVLRQISDEGGNMDRRFAPTRCWSGATVFVVKPGAGCPQVHSLWDRFKNPGCGLMDNPPLLHARGLGMAASTGCYLEPWR